MVALPWLIVFRSDALEEPFGGRSGQASELCREMPKQPRRRAVTRLSARFWWLLTGAKPDPGTKASQVQTRAPESEGFQLDRDK